MERALTGLQFHRLDCQPFLARVRHLPHTRSPTITEVRVSRAEVRRQALAEQVASDPETHCAIFEGDVVQGDPGCDSVRLGEGPVGVVLMPLQLAAFVGLLVQRIVLEYADLSRADQLSPPSRQISAAGDLPEARHPYPHVQAEADALP